MVQKSLLQNYLFYHSTNIKFRLWIFDLLRTQNTRIQQAPFSQCWKTYHLSILRLWVPLYVSFWWWNFSIFNEVAMKDYLFYGVCILILMFGAFCLGRSYSILLYEKTSEIYVHQELVLQGYQYCPYCGHKISILNY